MILTARDILVFLLSNLFGRGISWMSKRKVIVALSTIEDEYIKATNASKEDVWL